MFFCDICRRMVALIYSDPYTGISRCADCQRAHEER